MTSCHSWRTATVPRFPTGINRPTRSHKVGASRRLSQVSASKKVTSIGESRNVGKYPHGGSMRRIQLLPLVLLLAGCPEENPTRTLILLHTNDEHSHVLGSGPEIDEYPTPTTPGTGTVRGGI